MLDDAPFLTTWTTWLASTDAPRRLTTPTIAIYRQHVAACLTWMHTTYDVPYDLSAVTAYRLEQYRAYLQYALHRAPATQTVVVAALRLFTTWLQHTGVTTEDLARRLKAQPEQTVQPRALDSRCMRKLLDAAHQPDVPLRDTLIIELLAVSGMRSSEIAAMQVEDVTRGARTTWVMVRGKGNKRRRIALPKRVGLVLDAYLAERSASSNAAPIQGAVLVGQRGALTRTTINRIVTACAERARLTAEERALITPHAFRHTVATHLAHQYPLTVAADVLGHANLNTTRRYVLTTATDLEDAADFLDQQW